MNTTEKKPMETEKPGIIPGGIACDDRGSLRFINEIDFAAIKRFYQIENHEGVIRAFHGHLKEGKYVYVASGSAKIVLLKLNSDGKIIDEDPYIEILDSRAPRVFWIPPGYANGMKSLEPNTKILFFSTSTLEEAKDDDYRFDWDFVGEEIWGVKNR